jgi:hypothetical protein
MASGNLPCTAETFTPPFQNSSIFDNGFYHLHLPDVPKDPRNLAWPSTASNPAIIWSWRFVCMCRIVLSFYFCKLFFIKIWNENVLLPIEYAHKWQLLSDKSMNSPLKKRLKKSATCSFAPVHIVFI